MGASELSDRIAAVAPVAGVRYPDPNNATRKMPIIAFHGTEDAYRGHVGPAVTTWARFNECQRIETRRVSSEVVVHRHTDCTSNADVVLVLVEGGGHNWPGSTAQWGPWAGYVTHQISASDMMNQFFDEHPLERMLSPTLREIRDH